MQEVTVSEFKAKCLALIDQVNKTKKPLRITRRGKVVAELVPPAAHVAKGRNFLGSGADTFDILDNDVVGPIIDFKS